MGGMGNWQWLLDLLVAVLLAATLLRAHRLDQALRALRRDSVALEALVSGFDATAKQARSGIETLRDLSDGSARRVEQQAATALALRDDLADLIERGERLTERLDHAMRAVRTASGRHESVALPAPSQATPPPASAFGRASASVGEGSRVRSKAERDLLMALQAGR